MHKLLKVRLHAWMPGRASRNTIICAHIAYSDCPCVSVRKSKNIYLLDPAFQLCVITSAESARPGEALHVQAQQHLSGYSLSIKPKPLQAAEAAVSASAGRITAWDISDSMRLGHDYAADVVLRRSLGETPLSARLTFARDGSVRIQVCLGFQSHVLDHAFASSPVAPASKVTSRLWPARAKGTARG